MSLMSQVMNKGNYSRKETKLRYQCHRSIGIWDPSFLT